MSKTWILGDGFATVIRRFRYRRDRVSFRQHFFYQALFKSGDWHFFVTVVRLLDFVLLPAGKYDPIYCMRKHIWEVVDLSTNGLIMRRPIYSVSPQK